MQSKPLAVAIGSNIGGSLYDQWVDESREPWLVVHLLIAALIQLLRMENRCRYNLGDIWLIKPMPYAHIYNFAKESNSNMIIFNSLRQPQRPSCEGDVQQRQQHQQEQQQQQQRQQHHDNSSSSSNDNSNSNNGSSNSNSSISSISTATAATATGDNRNSNSNCSSTTAIRSTATMATAKACKSKGRQQKQQQ